MGITHYGWETGLLSTLASAPGWLWDSFSFPLLKTAWLVCTLNSQNPASSAFPPVNFTKPEQLSSTPGETSAQPTASEVFPESLFHVISLGQAYSPESCPDMPQGHLILSAWNCPFTHWGQGSSTELPGTQVYTFMCPQGLFCHIYWRYATQLDSLKWVFVPGTLV